MSAALTLSFDDSQIVRLDKAAAERRMSREELVKDILAAFLDDDDGSEFTAWQATGDERGAVASEADLDRIRRKYD